MTGVVADVGAIFYHRVHMLLSGEREGGAVAARLRVFRRFCAAAVVLVASGYFTSATGADDIRFFRIGTGGVAGTYFPVGRLIAEGLTAPPAPGTCTGHEPCGIPGVVAVAQTANGSVANVDDVASGDLDAGLAQADVIHAAYTATGPFAGRPPLRQLRAVARLYAEAVHIVARRDADIRSVVGLKGRRVALDEPGSGTLVDARVVLDAYGLDEGDLKSEYIKPDIAGTELIAGDLDAFFIVAGYPTLSVTALADRDAIDLVPISTDRGREISSRHRFFAVGVIPEGVYHGIDETQTLMVSAQLVVNERADADLVYALTKALWSQRTQRLLSEGHPRGKDISLAAALDGVTIPLHLGAERFYRESGLMD